MIRDILQELEQIKSDMKTAITNKGVEPTGGLTTYADAIRNIPHFIEGEGFDFSSIGYNSVADEEANMVITSQIDYCKSIADSYNWKLGGDVYRLFFDDLDMIYCPNFDTSDVTNMGGMFENCENLRIIPLLDCGSVINTSFMCYQCELLTYVGGFKDLGKQSNMELGDMFYEANNLSHDSIMNIINNLYNRAAAGHSIVTLPLGSTNLSRISDEEKAVATNKGWTLT